MQKTLVLILAIGFAICVVPQNTISQDTQDWHLRHLPEGVKARIGKGEINGRVQVPALTFHRRAYCDSAGAWYSTLRCGVSNLTCP